LKRLHLIEIEDQPWCPAAVRDGGTDYLKFVLAKMQPYRSIAPRLASAIERTGATTIIDLCSGAGGPWPNLYSHVSAELNHPVEICLTDRYPNITAWRRVSEDSGGKIRYISQLIDAGDVPVELTGFRTIFSGFHHFPPLEASRIIHDPVSKGQGIGIFEATERSVPPLLGMLFVPLIIALVTPAIRPFRWSRLFLTYLLPLIPFMGFWDGFVSCLRTYTVAELKEMAAHFAHYTWKIGQDRVKGSTVPVTYAIGFPSEVSTKFL
jgi:hypothetical protein